MSIRITRPKRPGLWLSAGLAALGLGLAGVALAGDSGSYVYVPELGVSLPADKAALFDQPIPPSVASDPEALAAPAQGQPEPIPAEKLDSDVPVPVPPDLLKTTNGWLTSDGRTLVAVYAGEAPNAPGFGKVVIVRQDLAAGEQTIDVVDAGKTGPLAISDAPEGAAVETSAQQGQIGLEGASGITATLDLAGDSIDVYRPGTYGDGLN